MRIGIGGGAEPAVAGDRPKRGGIRRQLLAAAAQGFAERGAPLLPGPDRAGRGSGVDRVAVGDADEVTQAFLVGLAPLDEHGQPGGMVGEATDVQADSSLRRSAAANPTSSRARSRSARKTAAVAPRFTSVARLKSDS